MKKYVFSFLIERDEDSGFIACVPELKGCHTQVETIVELMSNVREALNSVLKYIKKMKLISVLVLSAEEYEQLRKEE